MISSSTVKKTGHKDIDTLFLKAHSLIRTGENLQKDIMKSLAYKPKPLRKDKRIYVVSETVRINSPIKD